MNKHLDKVKKVKDPTICEVCSDEPDEETNERDFVQETAESPEGFHWCEMCGGKYLKK